MTGTDFSDGTTVTDLISGRENISKKMNTTPVLRKTLIRILGKGINDAVKIGMSANEDTTSRWRKAQGIKHKR